MNSSLSYPVLSWQSSFWISIAFKYIWVLFLKHVAQFLLPEHTRPKCISIRTFCFATQKLNLWMNLCIKWICVLFFALLHHSPGTQTSGLNMNKTQTDAPIASHQGICSMSWYCHIHLCSFVIKLSYPILTQFFLNINSILSYPDTVLFTQSSRQYKYVLSLTEHYCRHTIIAGPRGKLHGQ